MSEFENLKQQINQYIRTGMAESKRQQLLRQAEKIGINAGQLVMLIKSAEMELKFATGVSNTEYPTDAGSGFMTNGSEEQSSGFVGGNSDNGSGFVSSSDNGSGFVSSSDSGSGFISGTGNGSGSGNGSGFISSSDNGSGFISETNESSASGSDVSASEGDSGFASAATSFSEQFTEIKKLESAGAMSDIYSAIHLGRRKVIIKRIKDQYRKNQEYIDLFYKEFDTGYSLENTNIVHFYGKGTDDSGPYYYMEFVDGRTLTTFIHVEKNHKLDIVTKITLQILDAMKYMHQKQVFHRDLKPDNIMLTFKGDNVKIIDFGLATEDTLVDNLLKAGTPKYSAPELLNNATMADQRSDIYSLGMIIIEMFTGSPDRRKLSDIGNSLFRKIADKATMLIPDDRYQSCDEIISELSAQTSVSAATNPIPKWLEDKIKEYSSDGLITRNERTVIDKEVAKAGVDKELVEAMILDECEKALQRKRNEEARRRKLAAQSQANTPSGDRSVLRRLFQILIIIAVVLLIVAVAVRVRKTSFGGSIGTNSTEQAGIETFNTGEIVYTTTNVNLRQLASETSKILRTCPKNTAVEILDVGYSWVEVKVDNKRGYMMMAYLSHKRR